MNSQQRAAMQMALEALENNRQTHYYCEDNWYSCPKHEDGCANDAEGDECNCGADKANMEIDAAITALREALAQPKKPDECANGCPERTICDYCTAQPQGESSMLEEIARLHDVIADLKRDVEFLEQKEAQPSYDHAFEVVKAYQRGVKDAQTATPPSVEAAIEATKEKAAKVCEAIRIERIKSEWDAGHETGCSSCAAAIRSMK